MNNSANEPVLALIATAGPMLAAILLVSMVVVFLITGYSMKFALAVAGVGRFGFWKSIGIVFLTTLATMVVSGIAVVIAPADPLAMLMAAILGVFACAMVIAMVARCGIGKGVKTYFYNGLFGTIGMVIFTVCLIAVFLLVGPNLNIDQEALAQLRDGMPNQGQMWSNAFEEGFDEGFGDKLGSLTNVSFSAEDWATGSQNAGESLETATANPKEKLVAPVNSSDSEVQDAFYRPLPKKTRESGRGASIDNLFKGVRENPFVK